MTGQQQHPSLTDTTMRFVEDLHPEETTATDASLKSSSSATLTQTIWRKASEKQQSKRKSQFLVTMCVGESLTDVFPEWLHFSLYGPPSQRRYRPYDLNMPLAIPRRSEARYRHDPPLTEHGKVTSFMTARGILRHKLYYKVIYCAPEMIAVQTANTVALAFQKRKVIIKIEPALANWRGFYPSDAQVTWESNDFYSRLEYPIDKEYTPFLSAADILPDETPKDYLQRLLDFYTHLANQNAEDCALIIGHASTLNMAADGVWDNKTQLLDIERARKPCQVHAAHLGVDNDYNVVSRPTLPLTATLNEARYLREIAAKQQCQKLSDEVSSNSDTK